MTPSAAPVTSRFPLWLKAVQLIATGSGSKENWSLGSDRKLITLHPQELNTPNLMLNMLMLRFIIVGARSICAHIKLLVLLCNVYHVGVNKHDMLNTSTRCYSMLAYKHLNNNQHGSQHIRYKRIFLPRHVNMNKYSKT